MAWIQKTPLITYKKNDDIITKLAKINGIKDIKEFLEPSIKCTYDPCILNNIVCVSDKIIEAINTNKKIAISSDVDLDGVTSTAIIYRFLKQFTNNIYYIFSERDQGHGIENQIDKIEPNTNLLIIVDSSTNSIKTCKKIKENGIDIIIIDHHLQEEKNPYAIIVNPQLDDYPNKQLSGAAVVYKVIQVIYGLLDGKNKNDFNPESEPEYYLDLVASGLIADVMSVRESENRYLILQGLKNINNPGLKAILKENKIDEKKINSQTVAYTIGPSINGAARMGNIEPAIKLLIEDDPNICKKLAKQIKKLNDERKKLEAKYFEEIKPQINENDKVIIVTTSQDSEIDKSFNGLIAMKIAPTYRRPAMVLQENPDKRGNIRLTGSFRSFAGFNMKLFLDQFKVSQFTAGHNEAGGYAVYKEKLETLKKNINNELKNFNFQTEIEYDLELNINEIDEKFIKDVEKFNYITGSDLPTSRFLIKNLMIENVDIIGSNKDTIKIRCENDFVLMKFRSDESFADKIGVFDTVNVVGALNLNEFFHWGKRELIKTNQMFIDDIEVLD